MVQQRCTWEEKKFFSFPYIVIKIPPFSFLCFCAYQPQRGETLSDFTFISLGSIMQAERRQMLVSKLGENRQMLVFRPF